MTTVTSPGSSANLGPGFDVLGVALGLHTWVNDEGHGHQCGPDHIARVAYERAGGDSDLWFGFDLPPGRGLGFSASARAAGAVLGRLHCGDEPEEAKQHAYEVVLELEGHGDNAAPSVFGGLFVIAGDLAHKVDGSLPGEILCWIPNAETSTDASRACLGTEVARSDAVFNLGRLGLLMSAIYEQDPSLLRRATEDRLHQRSRLVDSPASAAAMDAALVAGACAAWLSGSGPTVAMVVDGERLDAVRAALPPDGDAMHLPIDSRGCVLT